MKVETVDPQSLSSGSGSGSRGKACVACRRRKLKCDGVRPFCSQCKKSKIEDDCEYQDGIHKSHTRLLLEQIEELETRLQELENEQKQHADGGSSGATTPTEGHGTPAPASPSLSFASTSTDSIPLPRTPRHLAGLRTSTPFEFGEYLYSHPGTPPEDLTTAFELDTDNIDVDMKSWATSFESDATVYMSPEDLIPPMPFGPQYVNKDTMDELTTIFIPHRYQVGLKMPSTNISSLTLCPTFSDNVLLHAICLWGCHFSISPRHRTLISYFLSRSRRLLNDALRSSSFSSSYDEFSSGSGLVDAVRASCLLALYFLVTGNLVEGRYHASAAVSLAFRCRLHQVGTTAANLGLLRPATTTTNYIISSPSIMSTYQPMFLGWVSPFTTTSQPPSYSLLYGTTPYITDQVQAFWQVFYLDKSFAVLSGMPSAFPGSGVSERMRINTPWPADSEGVLEFQSLDTLSSLHDAGSIAGVMSQSSLCVRAAAHLEAIYSYAANSSSDYDQNSPDWSEIIALEQAIERTLLSVPPASNASQILQTNLELGLELITAKALLLTGRMGLLRFMASAYQTAIDSMKSMLSLIRSIDDGVYQFLDPIMKICWQSTLELALQHQAGLMEVPVPDSFAIVNSVEEINIIMQALKKLELIFPNNPRPAAFSGEKEPESLNIQTYSLPRDINPFCIGI